MIIVNDKEVLIPASLSEFTLGQRIAFQQQFGNDLDAMLTEIMKIEDETEKQLESANYLFEKMFACFAFFAGTTVQAVKESDYLEEIITLYGAFISPLFDEPQELELKNEFTWKNEVWCLASPELKNGDPMKFGEFIDSKQLVKDMVDQGMSVWEYTLPLCAIYLRRKGEDYREEFLWEGSQRLKLMEDLPLDIAMQVGFFLSNTQRFCSAISTYSANRELREAVSLPASTLTAMAGSIF